MVTEHTVTRWSQGSIHGGTTRDGWGYEHNYRAGVSRAWRLDDPSFPELEIDGEGHEHAIFDLIAEQIIADEDRDEIEMRNAG